jgi:hypothetical protein
MDVESFPGSVRFCVSACRAFPVDATSFCNQTVESLLSIYLSLCPSGASNANIRVQAG